jgi:PTH2 family peptidyl-tRNA hydrolase
MEFKQCIIIRDDLKLSAGKLAVQVAHAAVMALERAERSDRSAVSAWKSEGQKKVVLRVPGLQDLFKLREDAERTGLPNALVTDAGLTEIPPGTVTALGIGPASNRQMDKVTGKLRLV